MTTSASTAASTSATTSATTPVATTDRLLLEYREDSGARIAYVTLNRPGKRNGLDLPMLRALAELPARIAADRDVRGVVLQGAGPAFCAGLDFASVAEAGPVPTARAFLKLPGRTTNLFQRACWAWRELPVPVVAVLHGPCFGGGLQLALAADFRIASADCELSVMEAKWGLVPDMTGTVTLRELLPMDVVKRLTMTAEVIDARQALELGLISEVADDPLARAEQLLARIAGRSPDAVAVTKRLLHSTWTSSPRRAFWTETVQQARLMRGANHRIARAANLAKEAPTWVARRLS